MLVTYPVQYGTDLLRLKAPDLWRGRIKASECRAQVYRNNLCAQRFSTVSKTNPNRNAYYSASNPMSTYYVLINGAAAGGQTGAHILEYTIEGVRNSSGRSVNVTDIFEITDLIP